MNRSYDFKTLCGLHDFQNAESSDRLIGDLVGRLRWSKFMRADASKLSAREAIARTFPSWDHGMADRIISWLDHCGYIIVEKDHGHSEATVVPAYENPTR